MKISQQPELLSKYKNQGTTAADVQARMREDLDKAIAKQKRAAKAGKVTQMRAKR